MLEVSVIVSLNYVLALAFLSNSCKHRHENRFHQNSRHENSVLKEALYSYEALHAHCYSRGIISELIQPILSKDDIKCKFIYVETDQSGLGNRMLTIVSYFLLGMLTDRVLLLKSNDYNLDELFCQPFKSSNWLVPVTFQFQEVIDLDPSSSDIKLKYGDNGLNDQWEIFSSESLFSNTSDSRNVAIRQIWYIEHGEQYLIPTFFQNIAFQSKLNLWFPNRNVATPLIRYLFHPQDSIWEDIVSTYTNRNSSRFSLGVHLRWSDVRDPSDDCFDKVPSEADVFISSLGKYEQNNLPLWMRPQLWADSSSRNWTLHQKYAPGGEAHNQQQAVTAIHDMWLLSLTDKTILAATSTFSYIIQSLRGKPLYMFHSNFHGGPDTCVKFKSHEPCCHSCASLLFETYNQTVGDRFMRCEDIHVGAKLIVLYDHTKSSGANNQ